MLRLGDVLENAQDFHWGHALYLGRGDRWTPDSPCLVLDPDLGPEGPDSIPAAVELRLEYMLGMQDVQQIVDNARDQLENLKPEQLVEAFDYYFRKDAFIDFRKS